MSGFGNDIVNASNELIRSTMESPNYVSGVSGWTINKDGSAQFNNLTVRGVFYGVNFVLNNNGLFFYNGTPTLGNLVESVALGAGIDPYGNAYKAGHAAYQGSISANQAAVLVSSELDLYTDRTVQDGVNVRPSVVVANGNYPGELNFWSGMLNAADTQSTLRIYSGSNTDPNRVFASGSEIDVNATHFGITGNMFVQGAHGIFGQDAGWITVGLASSWTARGGGWPPFQVFRSPIINGVMFVRGALTSGSNSIANGASIATFGAGYYNTTVAGAIAVSQYGGSAVTNSLRFEISTAGAVTIWGITTAGTLSIEFSGNIFLDNLS